MKIVKGAGGGGVWGDIIPELNLVSWSTRLPFKLRDPDSILDRTSTQGRKIVEAKELPLHLHQYMVRFSRLLG